MYSNQSYRLWTHTNSPHESTELHSDVVVQLTGSLATNLQCKQQGQYPFHLVHV